ncbi:FHA domain-containing protein [Scytonema hofmannii FACHB-248]|uniref:FHA domain-containing protein n=1 Tax=Scytonema hofmannii FACHB-248 TaxID=1842502 RepID=A0ABR8GV10_9CYAN|nr:MULTISPECIES: FHA domain-containing protein [Nostocales]MBD2606920.1 FHA domain-containing protein [Scytonema hofmannii FACHB-248]
MNTPPLQQWRITFKWNYNGKLINKQISQREATRDNLNGAIIRIGRDQRSCNLYLEDSSVSGEHAEIYFNDLQKKFFIRSLQPKNTLKVDGQDIVDGTDLPVQENSTIVLGRQQIEVNKIDIYQFPPTNLPNTVNPNSNPVNPNSNPVNSNPIPINLNLNLSNVDPKPDSNKSKHWWQEPTIQAAIIGAIVTLVGSLLTWNANRETQLTEKNKALVQQDTEMYKTNIGTLATKQEKAEDRYYKHKAENLNLEKDSGNFTKIINMHNKCRTPIKIAINFTALNDIQETRGWVKLDSEQKFPIIISAKKDTDIFLYASTVDDKYELKEGKMRRQKYTVSRDFDYISDDLTLFYPPGGKERKEYKLEKKDFFIVNFDKGDSTTKTFTCEGDSLQLKNE